jgi:hypothetical protein
MSAIPAFAGDKLFGKIELKQTDADPGHFMRMILIWPLSGTAFSAPSPCSAITVNQLLMARILL